MDPILAALERETLAAYRGAAGALAVLPEDGAGPALYAAIDRKNPDWVLLSPLLGSEIPSILDSDPDIKVAYAGTRAPADDKRLFAARFSPLDAAALAAGVLAKQAAERSEPEKPALAAAVFSGPSAQEAADAFKAAWASAGGPDTAIVTVARDGFAPATAAELKLLDVRVAYVSAPLAELSRWAGEAFAPETWIAAEYPLPGELERSPSTRGMARLFDALVSWNLKATLDSLIGRMKKGANGSDSGLWQVISVR